MTYKLSWHNPQLFLSSHLLLLWSFNVRTHSAALQTRFAILQFLCQEPRQHIKKQGHHFADKGPYSQSYSFSSSHVRMWELAHEDGRGLKNWCFQTVVLEKTPESLLDYKEIKPVNPKGNQPWLFIGRTDTETEAPTLWPPDAKSWLIGKDWCWERLKAKGDSGGRGWDD